MSSDSAILRAISEREWVYGIRDGSTLVTSRSSAKVSFLADSSHCRFGLQSRRFIRRKTGLYHPVIRQYQLFSSAASGGRFRHPQWNPEYAGEPAILGADCTWL